MAHGPPALDSGVALTFDDVLLVPGASEILPSASLEACGCFCAFSMSLTVISPMQW